MKTDTLRKILLCLVLSVVCSVSASVVDKHGWLKVGNGKLTDESGNPTQLKGVSFGWHCLWPQFYNTSVVDKVVNEWGANIVRCSIGLDLTDRSFEKNPELAYACVDSIVSGAVKSGSYVLIDFHSHENNLPLAKEFFTTVAKKYGNLPNVIYEVWNEPQEVEWSECKQYGEEIIPVIRKYAPNSIVIIPTPRWDQDVDKAADNPITDYDNIMYSLHYYAAFHKDDYRKKAEYALKHNLPIFITECASMMHTGDGVIDPASWEEWLKMADENGLSWIAWSISNKDETCSMLRPSASANASEWTDADLKPWAILVKYYLNK